MGDYSKIPAAAKLEPKPFKAHVDEQKLQHMKELIKLSPIGRAVFENTSKKQGENVMSNGERRYGMRRDWLSNAKDHWLHEFDWRKHEERINSFPQFTVPIKSNGMTLDIHFMALFSQKPDAVPIAFYHGWPGSYLEFEKLFTLLRQKYSPEDLPYHVVAPSLVGFGYSAPPPEDVDFQMSMNAAFMNELMVGLGFGSGYVAQGGDWGSSVAREQVVNFDACKSIHLNFCRPNPKVDLKSLPLEDFEQKVLLRGQAFREIGSAYAMEQGTRTGTIGLALAASPLALLSWIGEKFLEWTDEDPSLDEILEGVSLYWLTDSYPSSIYGYRIFVNPDRDVQPFIEKPSGYSFFPKELLPCPKSWAETVMNLVAYKQHTSGGHFAAMEKPKELLEDVEEWVKKVWKSS